MDDDWKADDIGIVERLDGMRSVSGCMLILACFNLTPWQKHKLLEASVFIATHQFILTNQIDGQMKKALAYAVGVNECDLGFCVDLIDSEAIMCVRS